MRIFENGKYRDMTPEDEEYLKSKPDETAFQITELKKRLAESDYKAIKYAEGWYTEEEYAPIRAERGALRERIRELEAEI